MKIWKRNAIIASVLLLVCAGIYLNWSYNQTVDLTDTLDAEQVMSDETLILETSAQTLEAAAETSTAAEDYFAQVRLSRQNSRDSAVELLEQTIAYDEESEIGQSATQTLNAIVSTALDEAQIESLVVAKGFSDCVTYMQDDVVYVAVSAPAEGLSQADVALISDLVTAQTTYPLSQVRIIEVKS